MGADGGTINHVLAKKGSRITGRPKFGKFLGAFFAVTVIFGCLGGGNMFQANQAYVQFVTITGGENSYLADKGWLVGLMFAIIGCTIPLTSVLDFSDVMTFARAGVDSFYKSIT